MRFTLLLVFLPFCLLAQDDDQEKVRLAELDKLWAKVSTAVKAGDFEAYKSTCHPKGVLVAGTSEKTTTLAEALANWKSGFEDTKAGKMEASVAFRFTQRHGGATTAHEKGMFLYWSKKKGEEARADHVHFEAVLRKEKGGWKVLTEHQNSLGTKEEWDALAPKEP